MSYLRLIGRAGHVAEEHELLFALQVDARRPAARRAIARIGGGDLGAIAVLAGEVGQLIELLDEAGITRTGLLTRRGLAAAIRDGYDPWGRRQRHRDQDPSAEYGAAPHIARPAARDEDWSYLRADGALHCTLWVAEWPRIDVRALFLQPLLMRGHHAHGRDGDGARRPGARDAPRRARGDRNRDRAEPPGRVGQRTSQRQRHATRRRPAGGRARRRARAIRYAAYVTVSAPDTGPGAVDELEAAVSRVELEAKRAPLRLERMWGQQAEAFTYSLPLCRGLR